MPTVRVLYVTSEIAPFLSNSIVAERVNKLAIAMRKRGVEIRILAPRFGVISEKKHRMHVVVRLSGTNIVIGSQKHALAVKVASFPRARYQIYFIDNEDFFRRRAIFTDEKNNFFADNGDRLIFFCRGVLETVKNLEWAPDVVHCHDWMASLVPLYLKTAYKHDPILRHTKVLYTIYNNVFTERLGERFAQKAKMVGIEAGSLQSLAPAGFKELIQAVMQHADTVARAEVLDKGPLQELLQETAIPYIAGDEHGIEAYYKLYNQLAGAK
ncbi:MAG: glycogen/starch synthase [Bacteroidota bacterium]